MKTIWSPLNVNKVKLGVCGWEVIHAAAVQRWLGGFVIRWRELNIRLTKFSYN